ncbi:hypothetical protein FN846DRAFT_943470 [Sphaerosporella brunnea]|uniref:Uncharacterized protein n=1 Tax=Sphaerosporella brunnea TaxID=1250544 RepID=A0A5J5F0S1_9PEZI|nr:hypothetical protein FN846DRAFT_943470 [Sphaerosporella brunnea]
MQCHNGDNPDTPRSPRNKPFDLTDKEFSPHWSAGRPIQWSPSPSPLNISFTGPTSPARWPSPEIDSEGQSLRSPAFRPTKGDIEPSPFRLEPVKDAIDDKITPLLLLASSKAHFSTSLPDALRNINSSELGLLNSHPQEPFSPLGNDSLELLVPKIDVKAVPENRKQALISEFKKVIAELEATLEKRDEDVYTKELLSGAPTPPPRPTTFPRNRMARDCPMARWGELNPKLFLPPPFDSPQKENGRLSPVADGLYGAENVDADYWKGFDQTYDVRDRSFESIKSDEDLQPLRWKNKSKWIEKGVNVLTQLDEESLGSNSSVKVTPSKKEVRWKDEALPISPVAEIIPHDETPFHADLEIEAQDLPGLPLFPVQPSTLLFIENSVPGRQVETPISTENIKVEADSDFKHQASVEPAPQTPTRPALVAARNVNRELAANSPVNSPSGSVSGKLIKLFEELSKPGARSPPKTLDVSPANSGRLDSVAVEDMMTSTGFVMDGSVDGAAEADKKRDVLAPVQNDGTQAARHDGLDESF